MSAVLFLGPSLSADEARRLFGRPDLEVLPPAEQGDVLRALSLRPRIIGLVDGRFDGVPAVLHKEILHALVSGVHVLGAASMGALRAAELHTYGMQGIGTIFEAYRDGHLHDDDAVALLHAGPEHGYQPLSTALVDITASLVAAEKSGVIGARSAQRLHVAARQLPYACRQWSALLEVLREGGEADEYAALDSWLATDRVHAKRDDARALIECMRDMLAAGLPAFSAAFELQRSHPWEDFRARHEGAGPGVDASAVLDELRLDDCWQRLRDAALLRLLARREAARQGIGDADLDDGAALRQLRGVHALTRRTDLDAWLSDAGLDERRLADALHDRTATERLCELLGERLDGAVLVEAGLAGVLPDLRRRAVAKQALLDDQGEGHRASPGNALLLEWFFNERQGRSVPTDLDAHAATLGLRDTAQLLQLLAQEYLYWCATGGRE